MSRQVADMIDLARGFCVLIEASDRDDPGWLSRVAAMLPRLQAAVVSLEGFDFGAAEYLTPDLDARFELYSHLRELLGDRDGYWLEFDRVDEDHPMTGSLADDLTDIYCELKHGLRQVDEDPEGAVKGWREGYEVHWGQHLADAQRHLSALAAQGRLVR